LHDTPRQSQRERAEQAEGAIAATSRSAIRGRKWCGRRKRGAHLTTLSVNQRGRDQPQALRFGSAIARTKTTMHSAGGSRNQLDLHP
jgi:hypothetical protein